MKDRGFPYRTAGSMDSAAPRRYTAPLLAWEGNAVPHRFAVRRFTIAYLTLCAVVLSPALARAHAILEESTPPAGASVKPDRWCCGFATIAGSTSPAPASR